MGPEYVGAVLARLRPFVRDRVIRRTRLERVLEAVQMPAAEIRPEIERLLAKAGIVIDEDAPSPVVALTSAALHRGLPASDSDPAGLEAPEILTPLRKNAAIRAARRRMDLDRSITNHAKVLLSAEEEVGLGVLVRGDNGTALVQGAFARLTGESRHAAECLLLHNQGLVHSVTKRYAPSGMTCDDLFQHGMMGLIRAVELFDPQRGFKFSTYAMNWIRQSITRGIANESRLIRLPVHMMERVSKVWATRGRLTVDGEAPSVHELALACELTDGQTMECLLLGPQDILSLDTPIGSDSETTLADVLDVADPSLNPEHEVEYGLLQSELQAVLETLSEREASIISMRFGLTDGDERTLDQIGKVYGVTRERIRQIESRTMTRLRHPSRSDILRPYLIETRKEPRHTPEAGESPPKGQTDLAGAKDSA